MDIYTNTLHFCKERLPEYGLTLTGHMYRMKRKCLYQADVGEFLYKRKGK